MGNSLPDAARDALVARLAAEPDVEFGALFGSAAGGRMRPTSDVDVYVRLAPGTRWTLRRELDLASDLSRVTGREIDLVVEDRALTSVILRREVARSGVLLHERRPGAWTTLKAEAISAYTDLEPLMRRCGEGVRRAIHREAAAHG